MTQVWKRVRFAAAGAWGRTQQLTGRATRNRRLQATGAARRAEAAVMHGAARVKGRRR